MLKYKLTTEEHGVLDDSLKALYDEVEGVFTLKVEGATSKDKVNEFRSNNIELQDKLKAFDGVDMEKYTTMLETDRKVRNKELIDKGDFDTLLSEHTNVLKSDSEAKISALTAKLQMAEGNTSSLISKYEIEGAAHKAFSANKIQPEAQDAVLAQIRSMFSVQNGSVVALDGESIKVGSDGNYTVNEFVASQPEFMKVPSDGGKPTGGANNQPTGNPTAKRDAYSKLLAG